MSFVEDKPFFPGSVYTETLEFLRPEQEQDIPIYRVMDRESKIIDPKSDPKLDQETIKRMYKTMTTLNTMDRIMYEAQRQV